MKFHYSTIAEIKPQAFDGGLEKMTYLNLEKSDLTRIRSGAFDGLDSLDRLILWGNDIATLDEGAFRGLRKLEMLDLSENPRLSNLPPSLLDLPRLKVVYLGGTAMCAGGNLTDTSEALFEAGIASCTPRHGGTLLPPSFNPCRGMATEDFVLIAESATGEEFSVSLRGNATSTTPRGTPHRNYNAGSGKWVFSEQFVAVAPSDGTKMLRRATDGSISLTGLAPEWTTDENRPADYDENFKIFVGLHLNCGWKNAAQGARVIARGHSIPSWTGSWIINEDGTVSESRAPGFVLGWGDFTSAECWGDTSHLPIPNQLILVDASNPAAGAVIFHVECSVTPRPTPAPTTSAPTLTPRPTPTLPCADPSTTSCADGLCYTLYAGETSSGGISSAAAEERCVARGGHLARIFTAAQMALVDTITDVVPRVSVRVGAVKEGGFWRWEDGTAVTVDVWENDGDQYCSCYHSGLRLNDAACHEGWGYGDSYLCSTVGKNCRR
jgi:hypothetical protein